MNKFLGFCQLFCLLVAFHPAVSSAGTRHCNFVGNGRVIPMPALESTRKLCADEGKLMCEYINGWADPRCPQPDGGAGASEFCISKAGTFRCCTGGPGAGLPPENPTCYSSNK